MVLIDVDWFVGLKDLCLAVCLIILHGLGFYCCFRFVDLVCVCGGLLILFALAY